MDINIDLFIKIITFFISIVSFYWSQKNDIFNSKKRQLTNFYEFRERLNKLENEPKYIQEIEINVLPFFRKLSWEQVDFLINKNINLHTLTNIRLLFIYELCILEEDALKIPNKAYTYKKHLKSAKNISVLTSFVLLIIIFIGLILYQKLNMVQYLELLGLTLFLEFYVLYLFDGIVTYNDFLKNDGYLHEFRLNGQKSCSYTL